MDANLTVADRDALRRDWAATLELLLTTWSASIDTNITKERIQRLESIRREMERLNRGE